MRTFYGLALRLVAVVGLAGCGTPSEGFGDVNIEAGDGKMDSSAVADRGELKSGAEKSDEWTVSSPFHSYQVNAAAGDKLTIRLSSPDVRTFLRLITPNVESIDAIGDAVSVVQNDDGSRSIQASSALIRYTVKSAGRFTLFATTRDNMLDTRAQQVPHDVGSYWLTLDVEAASTSCGHLKEPCCANHACIGSNIACDVHNICDVCFAPGTLIATPAGEKKIEDIKIGDHVWSYDVRSQRVVVGDVTQTWIRPSKPTLDIELSDGTHLTVTENHPFFLGDGRYVAAGELVPGQRLYKLDLAGAANASVTLGTSLSQDVRIVSIATSAHTTDVYNFSVSEFVNYFAGGVLVHNY
jgi:hypothetical protein